MKILRGPAKPGLFILCVVFLTSCTWNSSRIANQPVVVVNGNFKLSAKDFGSELARKLKDFDALGAKDPENVQRVKESIVRGFILKILISDFGRSFGILVADDELEKEINTIRSSYPDDFSFRRILADEDISFIDWKEDLRSTLLERKTFQKITESVPQPTSEDMLNYYNNNKNRFRHKERVYLRQIIVDDLNKAQAVAEELKKKDFSTIAKKYSISPEGKNGGLVGYIEKGSVDVFDKAFSLPINGVSGVLESPYGFHIFKIEKKEAASILPFEQVKKVIIETLRSQKEQAEFHAWLDKQIRANRVQKNVDLIDSITVETRGER